VPSINQHFLSLLTKKKKKGHFLLLFAKKKKKAFLILIGQHTQLSSLQQSLDKYLYIRD
jgi:hypothetical protein